MKNKKKELYIFLHIMKCAGTTLSEHIRKNSEENEVLLIYEFEKPYISKREEIEKYIKSLKKDKIKVIFGHRVHYGLHKLFPNREVRYITFLRNPVDRAISHYNFDRMRYSELPWRRRIEVFPKGQRDLSIKFWLHNWINKERDLRMKNFIFRSLFLFFFGKVPKTIDNNHFKKLKKILNKFYFIGIVEKPEDFLFIYNKFKVRKFSPKKNISEKYLEEKTDFIKKVINPKLNFDEKIYNYCIRLNKKFKKENKIFYLIILKIWIKKFFNYYLNLPELFIGLSQFFRLPYRLSAKLKKYSKTYSKFIDFIKRI